MDNLIGYSHDHPDKSVLKDDDFFGFQVCPHCGSYHWGLYTQEDCPEWVPEGEDLPPTTMVGRCTDCGQLFTEDDLKWDFYEEYWFVRKWWADRMGMRGVPIIYLDNIPPIWGKHFSNQAIYMEDVFRKLALELLEEQEKYR